jgi:hypothetical protein
VIEREDDKFENIAQRRLSSKKLLVQSRACRWTTVEAGWFLLLSPNRYPIEWWYAVASPESGCVPGRSASSRIRRVQTWGRFERLMKQLDGLVRAGNTVIVIEHDMQVIAQATG